LLQAIARVNRPFRLTKDGVTVEKRYGLVVDYWGVSQDLNAALATFEQSDRRDIWRALEGDPAPVIGSAATRAEAYFKGRNLDDPWDCVNVFAADAATEGDYKADLFARFDADYREFAALMDRFLPDQRALAYTDRLARLTKIRALARATFQRDDGLDWGTIGAKVKDLIDRRIAAEVRQLMTPVSVLDKDFEAKISDLPHDEARASAMEHAIRAQIKERLDENPEFYRKLSERLKAIIDQMRQQVIDAATAVRELRALLQEVLNIGLVAGSHGLSEVAFAVYQLLENATADEGTDGGGRQLRDAPAGYDADLDPRLKSIAGNVEQIMARSQSIVDWQNNDDVLRLMRRDIKRELRAVGHLSEEQLNGLAANMVEIARRRQAP
jgi:type I restriction enzyme R subunit